MKKIILILSIILSFYINIIPVFAEEIEETEEIVFVENEVTENYTFTNLHSNNNYAVAPAWFGDDKYYFEDLDYLNTGTYSPAVNVCVEYVSGAYSYYTGNRPLLFYNNGMSMYTNGNWILDSFDSKSYNYLNNQYFINVADNVLYLNIGSYELHGVSFMYNCYYIADLTDDLEAANYARNSDLESLVETGAGGKTVTDVYELSVDVFPFTDDTSSEITDSTALSFDENKITIPDGLQCFYVDFLYHQLISEPYNSPGFRREYFYYPAPGDYTWDEFEYLLNGCNVGYDRHNDNVLVLGIGTCEFEGVHDGSKSAPNLQSSIDKITSWKYNVFTYKDYNSSLTYENETFYEQIEQINTVTASTTLEELQDNTDDSREDAEDNISNNPIIAFFQKVEEIIDGFTDALSNLISSLVDLFSNITSLFSGFKDSISEFGSVVASCFSWLPASVVDVIKFALLGACIILLVKAVKLFL